MKSNEANTSSPRGTEHFRRRNDVHFVELPNDGIALLDTTRSMFHGCNTVGKRIWELLQAPQTTDEIVARLSQEYVVDTVSCRRDVSRFLDQLRSQGLIVSCNG